MPLPPVMSWDCCWIEDWNSHRMRTIWFSSLLFHPCSLGLIVDLISKQCQVKDCTLYYFKKDYFFISIFYSFTIKKNNNKLKRTQSKSLGTLHGWYLVIPLWQRSQLVNAFWRQLRVFQFFSRGFQPILSYKGQSSVTFCEVLEAVLISFEIYRATDFWWCDFEQTIVITSWSWSETWVKLMRAQIFWGAQTFVWSSFPSF